MADEYTKKIIHYLNNQKFNKPIDNYDEKFYAKSEICGDWNEIFIKFDGDVIGAISYINQGCSLNIAVLEIVCEYLLGKKKEILNNLNSEEILNGFNYPQSKTHCIRLVLDAFE